MREFVVTQKIINGHDSVLLQEVVCFYFIPLEVFVDIVTNHSLIDSSQADVLEF